MPEPGPARAIDKRSVRRILVSSAADRRLAAASAWLLDVQSRAAASGETLILSSGRGGGDDFVRRLLSRQPATGLLGAHRAGLLGAHRATVLQLAAELATPMLARRQLTSVAGLALEALAARAVARCRKRGELEYFERVADMPGFAKQLARTLGELRRYEVTPEALTAADAGPAGSDLAQLLKDYEAELSTRSLVDPPALLRLAGDALREVGDGKVPYRVGLPLLWLDLSPDGRAEEHLLAPLAARAPSLLATVATGDEEGLARLVEVLGPGTEIVVADADASSAGDIDHLPRLERLRRGVFRPELAAGAPPRADDRSVELLGAPGEGRECVEIARRILEAASATAGYEEPVPFDRVPFDQVAVLLRDRERYLPLLEEALHRAEIPAYFSRGTARPHAAGRALLALLACAADRLSASRFAEYLSLGEVPPVDDDGAPAEREEPWVEPTGEQLVLKAPGGFERLGWVPDDEAEDETEQDPAGQDGDSAVIAGTLKTPQRWEELLVDAAVVGGRERWQRRLDGLEAELRLRLEHRGEEDDDGQSGSQSGLPSGGQAGAESGEGRAEAIERQLRRLDHLRRFALPLIDRLAKLPEGATWGTWLDHLRRLANVALRRPESVLQVLRELAPMAEVGPVGLPEVRRVLADRLAFLRTEPSKRRYGQVFVGTVDEVRGRDFHTVFLPGLAEGIFPRRAAEDPLLLDAARQSVDAALPRQDLRVQQERLRLRLAAGAARQRLVASYPNLDAVQGRARVPSFYALDLLRAAQGALPDVRQLEAQAAEAAGSRLGWPAPADFERAIDNAEFDLAVLEPLLGVGTLKNSVKSSAKGQARYLLQPGVDANGCLARSLRTRGRRWRNFFSGADGLVDPQPSALAVLQRHRLAARSYSPTALQGFAACPYRFLLHAVHRLRPRERPGPLEQLDPLTRGSLFHEVQHRLFQRLKARDLLPLTPDRAEAASELAADVLAEVAGQYRETLAPAIPRVWDDEIRDLGLDLRGWLRAVVDAGEPWVPSRFELSFGLGERPGPGLDEAQKGHDTDAQPAADLALGGLPGGARLRGAIDLLEEHADGGRLRVTDHKTGKKPSGLRQQVSVGGGELLQPVLYGLAAEALLEQPVEEGRLFYCTRRGGYEVVSVPLDEERRAAAGAVLRIIDDHLAEGFLPAAPKEDACRWCDFRPVCGPLEEQRLRRKKPQRLAELNRLRETP